jgi:hypothetical protein
MGSAHKGQFDYYGGIDMDSQFGQPTGTKPAFTDAQYRDKGWVPGKALTYTDEQGRTQLATLDEHEQSRTQGYYDRLRDQAYAAKAARPNVNVPFIGDVDLTSVARNAFFSSVGGVGVFGGIATAALDAIGLPNIGPFMDDADRNWDDARWSDNYSPDRFNLGQTVDHQGNKMNAPTSPAGGEQIAVAAPPGAPDQRVTQFKSLYPAEWTETLTDAEIIEMVENPDQLRYWLSWRQT